MKKSGLILGLAGVCFFVSITGFTDSKSILIEEQAQQIKIQSEDLQREIDNVEFLKNKVEALENDGIRKEAYINELMLELEKQNEIAPDVIEVVDVVFNTNDVTIPSNVTVAQLEKALQGESKNIAHLAHKFVEIEKTYGINAIYLSAKTAWESGWGKSDLAIYSNNLGGVKSFPSGEYRSFESQEACLDYIASFLSDSYLREDGKYYNGKSISGVAQKYNFGEQSWINGITSIGNSILYKIEND